MDLGGNTRIDRDCVDVGTACEKRKRLNKINEKDVRNQNTKEKRKPIKKGNGPY